MKNIFIVLIAIGTLTACKKHGDCHKNEYTICETVSPDLMPTKVTTAFARNYTEATVAVWFNQDNKGYTAMFDQNGEKTFAIFQNNGEFVKEYSAKEQAEHYSHNKYDKKEGKLGKGKKHHKKEYKKDDSCICKLVD